MIYSQSIYTELYFFVPPKCGWSTFLKLHIDKHTKQNIKYYHQIKNKLKVDVFLIRNPIDRFISAYKSIILKKHEKPFYLANKIKQKYGNSSLDTIINNLKELSIFDVHFYPLAVFYNRIENYPKYVLNINKDMAKIEELFGYTLPHENSTAHIEQILLTNDQKEKIFQVYKEDFQLFESFLK